MNGEFTQLTQKGIQKLMTTKETLDDIKTFDSTHLEKLRIIFYDRWTFETGSQADKEFLDVIEEELERRKPQPIKHGGPGTGINLASDGTVHMSVNALAESLKFNGENLFIKSKYGLRFGHDLERELRRVAREELTKLLLKGK